MVGGNRLLTSYGFLLTLGHSSAASLHAGPDKDHADAFHDYMQQHGRSYTMGSDEYHQRLALFSQRRSEMEAQNSRPDRSWTAVINALSDRTEAELAQLRGWRGGIASGTGSTPGGLLQRWGGSSSFLSQRGRGKPLPQEFMEWTRLKSARSTDQGGCGSCWAVASSEVLQMHMEIYSPNSSRTFSTQELVSCVPNPHECGGTGGCEGATVELAFHWALGKGLAQESETPYKAADTACKKQSPGKGALMQLAGIGNIEDVAAVGVHEAPADSPAAAFGMLGFERLAENGYVELLRAVAERGPVAVSVAARPWAAYGGGVFDGCKKEWVIDHAVVLVGYGKDKSSGQLFYLIQNSWGPDWGEKGRIRVLRQEQDGENCGMDKQPLLGTGCKGGPKEVKVCGPCGVLYDSVVPHFKPLSP